MRTRNNQSDARTPRTPKASRNGINALKFRTKCFGSALPAAASRSDAGGRRVLASFSSIAAIFPVASGLRFFRDEHYSDDSAERAVVIFADSAGAIPSCRFFHRDMPGRVASLDRFEEANCLPVSEARCNESARPERDSRLLVVALK